MKVRHLQGAAFLALGFFVAATLQVRATDAATSWTSYGGFTYTHLFITVGGKAYIQYQEDSGGALWLAGDPPEYFLKLLWPRDIVYHQYNTPGTFTFRDNSGSTNYGHFVTVHVTIPPLQVSITEPQNNVALTAPATFTVAAQPSGGLAPHNVEFFVGTNSIGSVSGPPHTNTAIDLPAGTYTISAIVTDSQPMRATNSITVKVNTLMLKAPRLAWNQFVFNVGGMTLGKTNIIESSTNLVTWSHFMTIVPRAMPESTITAPKSDEARFFRVIQLP